MDLSTLVNSLSAVLLILMMTAVGFIFGKAGIFKAEHKKFITRFIIDVAVPCACVKNVFTSFTHEMLADAGRYLLTPLICMAFTLTLSYFIAKLLKIERKRFGTFVVMCALSNSLFIGYPVCHELFGDAGVPYVMFYYIVNTALFWTAGSFLIRRSGGEEKPSIKSSVKSVLTPPLICLAISVALLAVGFEPPHIIISFCTYMGGTVSPLALLYVGFIIYETGLKNFRMSLHMAVVLVMRFVVAPVAMLFLCRLAGLHDVGLGVMVIQAAMPVMTQSVVLSSLSGADEKFAALGMTLSTIACFIVVPVLMSIV